MVKRQILPGEQEKMLSEAGQALGILTSEQRHVSSWGGLFKVV